MKEPVNIFWFRRDLRLNDNTGLFHALKSGIPVLPVFIFDKNILDNLENKSDRRVSFIYLCLKKINEELKKYNSSVKVFHDTPENAFEKILKDYNVKAVYANRDYEPYATKRDQEIEILCRKNDTKFLTFKDQVIFEKDEISKDDGTAYSIYTPYSKKWKHKYSAEKIQVHDTNRELRHLFESKFLFPELHEIGFFENYSHLPEPKLDKETISNFHISRDYPYPCKTTSVSLHLRFGTISIRELVLSAGKHNEKYLNELIWREFFMQILWNYPYVVSEPFKKKYRFVKWKNDEKNFEKWRRGETGFPLVDAGIRELNETGFMHNRVRMVVANFLTKILLIDWRWGEAYFAEKLTDFELSSNNGNWQWAAGCGSDAAPYFRIFNPSTQAERFDPDNKYISRWIPGFDPSNYMEPIVDFNEARQASLFAFKTVLS